MVTRNYETLQLKLIGREYEKQGYFVSFDTAFGGLDVHFDAVARRESDNDVVFIVLANGERSQESFERLKDSLAAISESHPLARVDIRRIDPASPTWAQLLQQRKREMRDLRFLYASDAGDQSWDRIQHSGGELLWLWAHHASLVQAYASSHLENPQDSTSLLATYNSLLVEELLQPPESVVDGVSLDFFQLYDLATAALQGSPVRPSEVEQLRRHFRSVRSQIEQALEAGRDRDRNS